MKIKEEGGEQVKPIEEDVKPVVPGEEKVEKTFTQTELDKIVTDRVKRVKSEKPEDYEDLQAIVADLDGFGFAGTVAEKRVAIKAARAKNKADKDLKDLEEEAERTGHSPEILKELREAKKDAKEANEKLKDVTDEKLIKNKEQAKQKEIDDEWDRQFGIFVKDYPDIDTKVLTRDKKFIKYASKHKGELSEIFEDYKEFMEDASQSITEKFKKSESRSTGSGKNNPASGSVKLSTDQEKTMNEWNKRYPKMKMTPADFVNQ